MELWDHCSHCNTCLLENELKSNKDLNFIVYEQASNGLWDYIEHMETNYSIVKCSTESNKRVRPRKMDREWVDWMSQQGGKYVDVVRYAEKHRKSRFKYSRIRVFSDFISIYFKSTAHSTVSRMDVNPDHLEAVKIISKNAGQNTNE